MRRGRKNLIHYRNLTEDQKDDILKYIKDEEVSIKKAGLDLNLTRDTINKIFVERFGKKEKIIKELINN